MKWNTVSYLVAPIIATCVCISCQSSREKEDRSEQAGYRLYKSGAAVEEDFSPWMSKADLQIVHEMPRNGDYFAFVEGRNNGGMNEYRYVLKQFPAERYAQWAVFWGLSADEFYRMDLKMLREGLERENTQVFLDAAGKAHHQVVWLKKKGEGRPVSTDAP